MTIADNIRKKLDDSSWIRKMFEEGSRLKGSLGDDQVYDLSLGNPILEPPDKIKDELREIVALDRKGMSRYMSNSGFESVRSKIATVCSSSYKKNFKADNVVMTAGAAGGLNVALKTIIDPDDEIIIIAPYFPDYIFYVENCNGKIVIADSLESDFSLDIGAIESKLSSKTRGIIINSPNNPTGAIYSKSSLEALASLLKSKSEENQRIIYMIADDPYRKILFDGAQVPDLFGIYQNLIICRSFSKELGLAGERIGFMVISPEIDDYQQVYAGATFANRTLGFVNAPALMQQVVANFIDYQPSCVEYEENRNFLVSSLRLIGYEFIAPAGGFYLFVKSPLDDELEFVKLLKEYNILVVPGRGFGKKGYIRLAFCVNMATLEGAMDGFNKGYQKAIRLNQKR
ncbi:MAG: pyridoxal phosphate-dependent aminotransferase [Nitrospinota bacterium]